MRFVVCILTAIILLFSSIPACAADVMITATAGMVDENNEFAVAVMISDNPGFAAFQIDVTFDPSFVSVLSVNSGHALYDGSLNSNVDNSPNGSLRLYFVNAVDIVGDGELFSIRFQLNNNIAGESSITFSAVADNFINQNFEPLPSQNVSVNISASSEQENILASDEPVIIPDTELPVNTESTSSDPYEPIKSFTVAYETNGGSKLNETVVNEDCILAYPPTPTKENYIFDGWYIDSNLIHTYDFNLVVTDDLTLYAAWKENKTAIITENWNNPFTDVKESDWFYNDVKYVEGNGIMIGIDKNAFAPNVGITRAMFVTMLHRMSNISKDTNVTIFVDIPHDAWYSYGVAWAAKNGIVTGVDSTHFEPDAEITREQVAAMLSRYMTYAGIEYAVTQEYKLFADEDKISDYVKNFVQILSKLEIINGKDGNNIDPQGTATRAEVAAMVHRFAEKFS